MTRTRPARVINFPCTHSLCGQVVRGIARTNFKRSSHPTVVVIERLEETSQKHRSREVLGCLQARRFAQGPTQSTKSSVQQFAGHWRQHHPLTCVPEDVTARVHKGMHEACESLGQAVEGHASSHAACPHPSRVERSQPRAATFSFISPKWPKCGCGRGGGCSTSRLMFKSTGPWR